MGPLSIGRRYQELSHDEQRASYAEDGYEGGACERPTDEELAAAALRRELVEEPERKRMEEAFHVKP